MVECKLYKEEKLSLVMDAKFLEQIGLTQNESTIYLSLLHLGTARAGAIVKHAGINSGKLYEIFESLKAKGLISESVIDGVRHFSAAPPTQLLKFLEQKKAVLQQEEVAVKQMLPQLEQLRNATIPEIRAVTYTGFNGIRTAADEALASLQQSEEILGMGITNLKDERFNEFWKNWQKKRIARKIHGRHIFSEKSIYAKTFNDMSRTEIRVLEGITPVTVDIFGNNTVLILNYNEPVSCIMIQDKNTAASFRHFFEQLWVQAKK